MALRRAHRPDRRDHRRGPAERDAGVARQAHGRSDVAARRLRPLAVRPAEQGRGVEPRRCDERVDAADAHSARAGAHLGHRRAMTRLAAALLPLLLGACEYQNYQSAIGNAGAEDRQFLILFWIFLAICAAMYGLVIAFLIAGILRRRRGGDANVVENGRHHESHPLMRTGLIGWSALVGIGLFA